MFIRRANTRNKSTSDTYFTHRLVASERAGKQVRQITLLNLGRHFDLPQRDWPRLCARIEALLAGQPAMLAEPEAIEALAQRFAARLRPTIPGTASIPGYHATHRSTPPEPHPRRLRRGRCRLAATHPPSRRRRRGRRSRRHRLARHRPHPARPRLQWRAARRSGRQPDRPHGRPRQRIEHLALAARAQRARRTA